MHDSLQAHRILKSSSGRGARRVAKAWAPPLGIGMLAVLGACSSVSPLAKERVAQSETSVQQARQTIGNSEQGAVELQQAKDQLDTAKSALAKGEEQQAERSAAQAHLYAELAVAKSHSADARRAANEALAGVEALRQETERTTPTQR
jgi:Domain of unknown function (DUF4398)